ncbi:MAG: DUF3524 domain-containing protein [Actinomycetia bacterium]|nr:DUF3524 domain-containing protein [Actinomycetes bacterium]
MTAGVLDVILAESWYGGSHRQWADGLVSASRHRIRLVTHVDLNWRWRMRGGSVTLAEGVRAAVAADGWPDILLVSGLTDVASLVGLIRPPESTRVLTYLHENQLVYPPGSRGLDLDMAFTNWRSVVASDEVWFNSDYHRDSFFAALPSLFDRTPDHDHRHLADTVFERSRVMPVGVAVAGLVAADRSPTEAAPLVLWNQRWEHDKDPATALDTLIQLAADGVGFRVALAGSGAGAEATRFEQAAVELGERVVVFGALERADYLALLTRSDVVISTALHEFFGVAVVEAMAAGAVPVLPRRLSYPELVGVEFFEASTHPEGGFGARLAEVLADLAGARAATAGLRESMTRFDWSVVGTDYDDALVLAHCSSPRSL